MANGLVNVEGITNKEVEELAQILKELNELIGGEANTGGTVSAGTVMAKLNKLLTDWTTTRAGYLDTINTNAARLTNERATKLDNIGATNNTGGTASAGTVMAKLNKLLTDWTVARAGYLDTINTNIGATGNTGGSASAGTVMAKLNKLLTDWTAARVGYLDNIGATNNTGGTTSAGTVMGKLNKLLTDWTTTRAGKIDTINNAIGTTGNTGGTATAGTVMAKLNALIGASSKGLKVKSIQHGKADYASASNANSTRSINISSVNANKSILYTDSIPRADSSSYSTIGIWGLFDLTDSRIIQHCMAHHNLSSASNSYYFNTFSYYVIEFE